MPTGTIIPAVPPEFADNNGNPAAGHKLFAYEAGTTTKINTYSDVALATPNANPIILDSSGRATIFLSPGGSYKFVLAPPTDSDPPSSPLWTRDNINAVPASAFDVDITGTAGEALTTNDLVYLSAGDGGKVAGRWYKMDADFTYASTNANALGFATADIASGATGAIRINGRMTGLSGLTPGTIYYASATAGALTSVAPANARRIGIADTSTSLILSHWLPSVVNQGVLGGVFNGVVIGTSNDTDIAAKTVVMSKTARIVFDDGSTVGSLTPKSMDITAANGAGALDTGSEAASTWYELYAIHKSTESDPDLATALMAHRAKDFFADVTLAMSGTNYLVRDAAARTKVAQTFLTVTAGQLPFVDVFLTRSGSPTGTVYAELYATSAGAPTGAALATSDKLNVADVNTTAQRIRFVFRSPATVTAATTYALAITGGYTIGANHVAWRGNAAGGYAGGSRYAYDGATWTAEAAVDLDLISYVVRNDTAVTMPTGYDGKCLVGYVYNDSSSNFVRFLALDHMFTPLQTQYMADDALFPATIPALVPISAFVPPVPVTLRTTPDPLAAGITWITPVPGGFGTSSGPWRERGAVGVATGTQRVVTTPTEAQAIYVYDTSGAYNVQMDSFEW